MAYRVVTVFGGAGFLGRSVVSALAHEGAHVRVACRRPDEALRCKPMGDVGQVAPVAASQRLAVNHWRAAETASRTSRAAIGIGVPGPNIPLTPASTSAA